MTQTVPATAVLGPNKTGLTIGLRVLNLDGTEYAAFSTTGVAETSTAGTYRKAGGVIAPLAGGYIVWGTALVDYAEATVESAAVNVTYSAGVALTGRLAEAADIPAAVDVSALALEATAQAILEDTGTTLPTAIAAIEPGGGSYAGDGIGYYSDTIDDGTSPLDGVRVQLYTSPNRVGPAYEAYTNALGVFEMWPDPGTYYRWLDLAGYNFSQDVAVTVTEP